jgi:putative flippase GtrA
MGFISNPRERSRFLRFAIVGTIGAFVDFLTFNILNTDVGLVAIQASVFSFIVALTSNFILNRYWTFPDSRSKSVRSQMFQYALVNLAGLAIRTPVFVFANRTYTNLLSARNPLIPLGEETLANNLALGTAIAVVLFWNYFVNRRWTYSDAN